MLGEENNVCMLNILKTNLYKPGFWVSVVIPLYKNFSSLSDYEYISLSQCKKILANHPVCFIGSKNLDMHPYIDFFDNNENISYKTYDLKYFADIIGYNELCLSFFFYNDFKDFKYILIYQLDAFVFKDELEYWYKKEKDYIGAPLFESYTLASEDNFIVGVGNGGFSLRNAKKFYKILRKIKKINCFYKGIKKIKFLRDDQAKRLTKLFFGLKQGIETDFIFGKISINEDIFWSQQIPHLFNLNIPTSSESMKFSFEVNPSLLYEMNEQQLPFGCHAWEKYEPYFWKQFIDF